MEDEAQPEPAAPEIQARIRASFERQGLMRHLGARLGDIEPGRVQIVLPSRPEVTQQDGYIHAGATLHHSTLRRETTHITRRPEAEPQADE